MAASRLPCSRGGRLLLAIFLLVFVVNLFHLRPGSLSSPAAWPRSVRRRTRGSHVDTRKVWPLLDKQTAFSVAVARRVGARAAYDDANLVVSPLSIHAAFSLAAAAGAADGGHLLGSSSRADLRLLAEHVTLPVLANGAPDGGPSISACTSVWTNAAAGKLPAAEAAAAAYNADIRSFDFNKRDELADEINSWAANGTGGVVKDMVTPKLLASSQRELLLATALHFKGGWAEEFNKADTVVGNFSMSDGTVVQASFLTTRRDQLLLTRERFKVLRLPYERGNDRRQFSLYIFLPAAHLGLWIMADLLKAGPEFISQNIPAHRVPVTKVVVPKFDVCFAFDASTEAGDASSTNSVPKIYHEACVEVTEAGTEVVNDTALWAVTGDHRPAKGNSTAEFVANHPFTFLIREDNSGVVLLVGHVLNPIAGAGGGLVIEK